MMNDKNDYNFLTSPKLLLPAIDKFIFIAQPQNNPGQLSNTNPSVIQQSYYPAVGNAPPLGTAQQGIQTTTANQQMIHRIPQQNDPHFTNQPINQPQ